MPESRVNIKLVHSVAKNGSLDPRFTKNAAKPKRTTAIKVTPKSIKTKEMVPFAKN